MKSSIEAPAVSKKPSREQFASRVGFLFAAAGCAIGLGNIWRFPYITGQYGGAAFVVIYLVFLLVFSLPILIFEFTCGRGSKKGIARSFDVLEPKGTKWHWAKWLGLVGSYLLMMFYAAVAGWMLDYTVKSATGAFEGVGAEGVEAVFGTMLSNPAEMIACLAVVVVFGAVVTSFGLQKGIERASKVLMSLLFVLLMPCKPAPAKPKAEPKADKRRGFLVRYPAFCVMLGASTLMLAFHNITNTYLIQILGAVGGDSADLGVAIALAAVMELPVMFGFSRIARRWSAGSLLTIAGMAFVAKGVWYLMAGSVWGILAAQILQMFSFALFASASVYYAEESMEEQDKVTGQACMSCTITAGAVLGNLVGGWVLDACGVGILLAVALGMAVTGAVLAGVSERL